MAIIKAINNNIKIPPVLVLSILLILILPFLAQWATQFVQPNKKIMSTSSPTDECLNQIKQDLGNKLSDKEKILWIGQPEAGRENEAKGLVYYLLYFAFTYAWTIFALLWFWGALSAERFSLKLSKNLMIALFGLPFLGFGLCLLLMPFLVYCQDLETVYVITDAHVFKIVSRKPQTMTAFNWRAFGPIQVVKYSPDRCDIIFARQYSDDKFPNIGLYGIEQGDDVTSILENHLAARKEENLDPKEHFYSRPPD